MKSPDSSCRVMLVEDVSEVPVVGAERRWKPLRHALGVMAFGINAFTADADEQVIGEHEETISMAGGHEEVYLVVRGHARFTVDGEQHDAPTGALVFVADPRVTRSAVALADGTLILVMGGDPAAPYAVSPWEPLFLADAREAEGDPDGAIEIMRGAAGAHSGNAGFHYNYACLLARSGRSQDALFELNQALTADAALVSDWAAADDDLASLRGQPEWPL